MSVPAWPQEVMPDTGSMVLPAHHAGGNKCSGYMEAHHLPQCHRWKEGCSYWILCWVCTWQCCTNYSIHKNSGMCSRYACWESVSQPMFGEWYLKHLKHHKGFWIYVKCRRWVNCPCWWRWLLPQICATAKKMFQAWEWMGNEAAEVYVVWKHVGFICTPCKKPYCLPSGKKGNQDCLKRKINEWCPVGGKCWIHCCDCHLLLNCSDTTNTQPRNMDSVVDCVCVSNQME